MMVLAGDHCSWMRRSMPEAFRRRSELLLQVSGDWLLVHGGLSSIWPLSWFLSHRLPVPRHYLLLSILLIPPHPGPSIPLCLTHSFSTCTPAPWTTYHLSLSSSLFSLTPTTPSLPSFWFSMLSSFILHLDSQNHLIKLERSMQLTGVQWSCSSRWPLQDPGRRLGRQRGNMTENIEACVPRAQHLNPKGWAFQVPETPPGALSVTTGPFIPKYLSSNFDCLGSEI